MTSSSCATARARFPCPWGGTVFCFSEKLASVCGVGVGDTVTLTEQDSAGNPTSVKYTAKVTGVVENYIGYYVFIGTRALRGPDR